MSYVRYSLLFGLLLVSGCVTGQANRTWYNPTTWFSGSEGRAVSKLGSQVSEQKEILLDKVQADVFAGKKALSSAPTSQEVSVAKDFLEEADLLIGQARGSLPLDQIQMLTEQVDRLLSENIEIRAQGRKERDAAAATTAKISAKYSNLTEQLAKKEGDLRAAFDRENKIANAYRNQTFILWTVAIVAVFGYVGLLYFRIHFGGISKALGVGLGKLRARHPEAADFFTQQLDVELTKSQQVTVAKNA